MFKTIKTIINIFKEENAKEKARRELTSKMTVEEYRNYKGACNIIQKRKQFIDYQKSRCNNTSEYDINPVVTTCDIIGIRKDPKIRKAFGAFGMVHYEDNNQYKITKEYTPSINQQIRKLQNSKEYKLIDSLVQKYM